MFEPPPDPESRRPAATGAPGDDRAPEEATPVGDSEKTDIVSPAQRDLDELSTGSTAHSPPRQRKSDELNGRDVPSSEQIEFSINESPLPIDSSQGSDFEATEAMGGGVPGDGSHAVAEDEPTVIRGGGQDAGPSLQSFTTHELGSALVGTRLQNYELEEFVGGGGMGAVFRALDLKLGRMVALKVLARTGPNGELAKRFINEAQSAAQLDHENIARVYNVDEAEGLSFIVFEFVEGINLRDAVAQQGPLAIEQTLRYTLQVAEALEHAAARHVIHRDIKPSNILLTANGRVKLVDMGLARMSRVDAGDPDLTASGMTLGTFDYLSPEQARDPRQADIRSDLYSLGCTIYFMLTGTPPFPDGTAVDKLLQHREGKRPDPRRERSDVPVELATMIRRLMATNPRHRFQTPTELMAEISLLAQRWGISLGSSPGLQRALAQYATRRTWVQKLVPIAVPALLLFGGLSLLELLANDGDSSGQLAGPIYAQSIDLQDEELEPTTTTEASDAERSDGDASSSVQAGGENAGSEPTTRRNNSTPKATSDEATEESTGSGVTRTSESDRADSSTTGNSLVELPPGVVDELLNLDQRDQVERLTAPFGIRADLVGQVTDLYVGRRPEVTSKRMAFVAELEEAVAQLDKYPNLQTIHLNFDEARITSSLLLPEGDWRFVAAAGRRPLVRFVRTARQAEPNLVSIEADSVEWEGVDFLWEVPSSLENRAFFQLEQKKRRMNDEQRLTLRDCTMTVRRSLSRTLAQSELTIVQIAEPPASEEEGNGSVVLGDLSVPPRIQLQRCAIRGPVALVSTPRATPFTLAWEQGLFVSDRRLLESHGAKQTLNDRIRIQLDQVTVAAELGFARVEVSMLAPHQLPILLTANRTIFEIGQQETFVEYAIRPNAEWEDLLNIDGRMSYYPYPNDLWTIRHVADTGPVQTYDLTQAAQEESWFVAEQSERASRLMWNVDSEQRSTSVARRLVADYVLFADPEDSISLPVAGFDADLLPRFPLLPSVDESEEPSTRSSSDTFETRSNSSSRPPTPTTRDERNPSSSSESGNSSTSPSTNGTRVPRN